MSNLIDNICKKIEDLIVFFFKDCLGQEGWEYSGMCYEVCKENTEDMSLTKKR